MRRVSDEILNGTLYFYHSAKGLDAYKYLLESNWRTSSGHYGHALYGNLNPLWKDNFSGSPTDQNRLYGPYRFKVQALRSRSLLFCNVQDGAKILADYDADYAQALLEDHGVPSNMIKSIMSFIRKDPGVYASATSLKPRNNSDPGTLLQYGFNGFVYDGNLDGKTVVFYNPQPTNVRFVGVSFDDGKTFMDIPKGTSYSQFLDLVEAFRNPKAAKAAKPSTASTPSTGAAPAKSYLLPPSVIKYMSKPVLKAHLQKVYDLDASFKMSTMTTHDIIFIESWYIRFNLTHRRKIYGWVSNKTYNDLVAAAYVVAYSCVDSLATVDVKNIYNVADVKRLFKYLLPFSIKNKFGFSVWTNAFGYINFENQERIVCTWGVTTPTAVLARFLAGAEWAKNTYNFDILSAYFDLFKKEYENWIDGFGYTSLDAVLTELNADLPTSVSIFVTGGELMLDPVESVSSTGIVYK